MDGIDSRTEDLLKTGIEETKKPLSRIEAILRGEDIKPLSRIEQALKDYSGGSSNGFCGEVTWIDTLFYTEAFEIETHFTDEPNIEYI